MLLVLEIQPGRVALWAALIGGWALIGALVIAGPAAQDTASRGPFCASLNKPALFLPQRCSTSRNIWLLVLDQPYAPWCPDYVSDSSCSCADD